MVEVVGKNAGGAVRAGAGREELAAVIAFLASAAASYVSGQVLSVDGGVRAAG